MSNLNYKGVMLEKLKLRMDMSGSDGETWESDDDCHDLKKNLTESDEEREDDFFFEGAEKLLEIWFTTKNPNGNESDLRTIPRYQLESMLNLAKCEIISSMTNSEIDAYVLSESSLFVSKRRIILKTCGTTTPLDCIERIIWLVQKYTQYDMVEDIYYSRKNFKRPFLQHKQHKSFENEVRLLDKFFQEDGAAYCMGTINKDCWFMYTLNPIERCGFVGKRYQDCDQTIEILMNDLDDDVMKTFYKKNTTTAELATKKSGINKLVFGMKIDDCLFEPCGYSMNAIAKPGDACIGGTGDYATIHITPEPEFSYVSYETNVARDNYQDLIRNVVDTFKPGKFIITFYASRCSKAIGFHDDLKKYRKMDSFHRNDIQFCSFEDCDMTYAHFSRQDF